jgi:hypothetical protein
MFTSRVDFVPRELLKKILHQLHGTSRCLIFQPACLKHLFTTFENTHDVARAGDL